MFTHDINLSRYIYLGAASIGGRVASNPGTDGEECQHKRSAGQTGRDVQVPTSVNTFICLISLSV